MNMIREKHKFIYHNKVFYCSDLTWWDYILILQNQKQWLRKILLEHNKKMPLLNERQVNEFLKILLQIDKEDKGTSKIDFEELRFIEGQMMINLKQSLNELRSWTMSYFMGQYKDIPYLTWAKEYSKDRHSKQPDKKTFKQEFNNLYN